jgi:hypothetical protein
MAVQAKVIFAVFGASNPTGLEAVIASTFPTDYLKIRDGEWLISAEGTAKDISDRLGISTSQPSNGIVVSISGYYGRQPTNVWEWIRAKS